MPTRSLRVRAAVVVAAVAAGAGLTASPVAAAPAVIHVAGNFVGDGRVEVFEYRPGAGSDFLFVEMDKSANRVTYRPVDFSVTGTYSPFAGDFDGDGHDELFWYGGGTNPDRIWSFDDETRYTTTDVTVGSLYHPVAGDFTGDGAEDILWYAPGTTPDSIWEFDPGGLAYTSHPITLNSNYVPVAGDFTGDGGDDVVLYQPGAGTDRMLDFRPGSTVPTVVDLRYAVNGENYRPIALDSRGDGRTDILWYASGAGGDHFWNFLPDGGIDRTELTVDGRYDPVAGDLFDDGYDDVFWFGSPTTVWDWHLTAAGTLTRTVWALGA